MIKPIVFVLLLALAPVELKRKFFSDVGKCLKESNLKIEDLEEMDKQEEMPDKFLCYMKCFLERVEFLDEKGKIHLENYDVVPETGELDEKQEKDLSECLLQAGIVKTCEDIRKVEKCFNEFAPDD